MAANAFVAANEMKNEHKKELHQKALYAMRRANIWNVSVCASV